jgi:flagellin
MGLRIATNVQSIAAQRTLGLTTEAQRGALEKLVSGTRINRAADDAAGLAISEKMRAAIRGIHMAVRNHQDAISLVQVAEGGMNEVSSILTRFRELSIQAASDTVGNDERGFIEKEVVQLKAEVNRIAQATEFNGKKLLNGTGSLMDFQVGLYGDADSRVSYNTATTNTTIEALGLADLSVATKESAQNGLSNIDEAIKRVSGNRATLGALQNRLVASSTNLDIYGENLSAARSRIADTDFAQETAEKTKQDILAQTGVSVLAQANQTPQLALKLMG